MMSGAAVAALSATAGIAQTTATEDAAPPEEDAIIVSGIRATIQGSIDEKRVSAQVYDALSAEEIGDLPALSIGEALETLTGAASHREQGGATEISIRGLGPFLGSTVVNGRVATNGSGDRSVNFSQFPSELFNEVERLQDPVCQHDRRRRCGPDFALSTVRPIDLWQAAIQAE